jgi:F0F1-type ATP synthase assembly protein I
MEEPKKPEKGTNDAKFYVIGMRYSALGFEFVGCLLVLGYLGLKVDERYGSNPWGIFVGLILGMALGLFTMIKQLEKLNR